ncbi:MAG: D-alanine--D-alanine ligase family protein [Anaerolineae bacterium]
MPDASRECEAPDDLLAPTAAPAAAGPSSLARDDAALGRLRLVAVVYSRVERHWFATEDAYRAEAEVVRRAEDVRRAIDALGIPVKLLEGDQDLLASLGAERPDLIVNLVDTLRGRDSLQMSVPAALELTGIPYTGAGVTGLVIGNDRNLTKQLLLANDIPTPPYQFISRSGTPIREDLLPPLIVKLNEGGGSVGIADDAIKATRGEAQAQADALCASYRLPVLVERFIEGAEVEGVVVDDGGEQHVYLGEKVFRRSLDGSHYFTSFRSYGDPTSSYDYRLPRQEADLLSQIASLCRRAFTILRHRDYAKYDVRIENETGTPYFIDCNPNTAFGPGTGLPMTEILALYGIGFADVLASLLSKHARRSVPVL